ncbi:MAG: Outer membrane protein OprM [Chlamydiia bacterium]|nr:Outer membrane protein OprM [Chlamydiia bacterium]MCH9615457.1 Outer membrane protein OprM [Chlamydiia bacterium]MCH9629112.1 Outer membrane protein OprM [Chlamydiia bacterium]
MSKKEQQENILETPTILESAERALAGRHFTLGDWPNQNWWDSFGQEELSRLIQTALESNPTLQAVGERIEFARQEALVTRAKLFPWLSFDGEEKLEHLSKNGVYHALNPDLKRNTNFIQLLLNFNYEVDIWGKNKNLYMAALGRTKAELAESKQIELVITSALAETYYALKTNMYRKRLYEALANVRNKTYLLQKLLEKSALMSALPPSLAYERFEESNKLLAMIDEEIAMNRHLINVLTGKGPDDELLIEDSLPHLPETMKLPANLSLDLLARRPDVMAAIWRAEAQSHEVGAAIADFYPAINLRGLFGLDALGFNKLFKKSTVTAGAIPAFHLPIFTAGAIRANVDANKAEFQQAVFDYNRIMLDSTREVADLLVSLESVYDRLENQSEILSRAVFRYNLTNLNYQKGLDNYLQVYAIEEEWIEKSLENALLMFDQYARTIELIKALGGGYDEKNISNLLRSDPSPTSDR